MSLGNGDGTFQAAQNFAVGNFPVNVPTELAAGDFIADVKSDVALQISLTAQ